MGKHEAGPAVRRPTTSTRAPTTPTTSGRPATTTRPTATGRRRRTRSAATRADDSIVMDEVIRTTQEGVERRAASCAARTSPSQLPRDRHGRPHARAHERRYDAAPSALADAQIAALRRQPEAARDLAAHRDDHRLRPLDGRHAAVRARSRSPSVFTAARHPRVGLHDRRQRQRRPHLPDRPRRRRAPASAEADAGRPRRPRPSIDQALYRVPNPADGGDAHTIASRRSPTGASAGSTAGDIVVSTHPGVGVLETSEVSSLPINPLQGNHGSTFTRDNFWLIAGGGKLVRRANSSAAVTNANAAPTALRLLGAQAAARRPGEGRQAGVQEEAAAPPQSADGTARVGERHAGVGEERGDGVGGGGPAARPGDGADEPGADDHAVGDPRRPRRRAPGVPIPKPTAAGAGECSRTAATSSASSGRQLGALAGHAGERDDVDEADRAGGDRRRAARRRSSARRSRSGRARAR